jgi:hypothetical protein
MAYNTVIVFTAGNTLPAADLNSNFANLDYLRYLVNAQFILLGAAMWASATSGASNSGAVEMTTNKNNHSFMDFSDSGGKLYAEIVFPMPADYNGGTITAVFHWTANSTSTNSVVWGIQGVSRADDDALDVAFGTAQEVSDANKATAYDLNVTSATPAITLSGTPVAGEVVNWRIYRDSANGSDTLAATARLIAVVINYTRS